MFLFYFAPVRLDQPGAAARHVVEISQGLARLGNLVYLFAARPASQPSTQLTLGFEVIFVPVLGTRWIWINTVSYYLMLPLWSWRYFRQLEPAVVYSRFSFLDWVAILPLKLFFRFTCVGEINGIRSLEADRGSVRKSLIALMEQWSLALCDKVICVTPELRQWAQRQPKLSDSNVVTIGNGVNTDLFFPMRVGEARQRLGIENSQPYIGFVGSLKPWHDLTTAIRALPMILELYPGIILRIVGEGPELKACEQLVKEIGLAQAVEWIGTVPGEEVPLHINCCQLCLAPLKMNRNSVTGISPIKVFEYMSCGRAFVTSQTMTSFDELIEESECGILVPAEEPRELAKAVNTLLKDNLRREQMGQCGRAMAVEKYSWQRISERIDTFIRE